MKRIDGISPESSYYAIKHDLPPLEKRPNKGTIAGLPRWIMHLPGQAIWSNYCMTGCSLADFPDVPPAKKHFPQATHEIQVMAIDPDFPKENLDKGGIAPLTPMNYVVQLAADSDDKVVVLLEKLAVMFVNGQLIAEPLGVTVNGVSAREFFRGICMHLLQEC